MFFFCFYKKYLSTFGIVKQQIANLPLLSRARLFKQPYRGVLQEVVEVFVFLFSGKGDDKGASFNHFFSNNLKLFNYESFRANFGIQVVKE